jgi:signal transduction histidine kinase
MWPAIWPRSIGARLSRAYALVFCVSVLLLATLAFGMARQWISHRIDQVIEAELLSLEAQSDIAAAIKQKKVNEQGLRYRLQSPSGEVLAGDLPTLDVSRGWFEFQLQEGAAEGEGDSYRALAKPIGVGLLIVAADTDDLENITSALWLAYAVTLLLTLLFAALGGTGLSRIFTRRLDQLAVTADDISRGRLSKRMPVSADRDEFDRLSLALNHMLDRNAALLEQQRQITNDMAHDLRTPLARLQQKLEAGNMSAALTDSKMMLDIVSSLLRITELEEGGRINTQRVIDLQQVVNRVWEAYQPLFEEQKKKLEQGHEGVACLRGDAQLISQLLSNLLDNALKHAASATVTQITIEDEAQFWNLTVSDNGPGVADDALSKVFVRFYRAESSRHTNGSGLGLSVVKAIARYHNAEVAAGNLKPGLAISVRFPKSQN